MFAIIQLSPSILAPPSAFVPQLCALCVLCGYFFRIGFLPTRSVTSVILSKNSRRHLTSPNLCYITRFEVYLVNSPSRPNLRPVDPPAPGGCVRQPIHLPAPGPHPARGGDGPATASPSRNLRAETRFSRQIQPNPDKSRHFQPPHSQRVARPPRQRPITNGRKRVPVLQTGNVLRWHTQACARGLAPAWAITWRAFSPQDVTDGHRTVPIGVHRRLKTVPFCVIRGLNWPLAIEHFKSRPPSRLVARRKIVNDYVIHDTH